MVYRDSAKLVDEITDTMPTYGDISFWIVFATNDQISQPSHYPSYSNVGVILSEIQFIISRNYLLKGDDLDANLLSNINIKFWMKFAQSIIAG